MNFDDPFSNLSGIKCTKFYSDSFRFDISIVWCLKGYFLRTQCKYTKVRFFHRQSNQIWSPIYWSLINLMFRIDWLFRFSMHFRSPITWSAISWSAVNWAYFMPIWLADSDFNLRCCAKEHALRVDAISSKRHHSNNINDTVHISSAVKNMFYRKSIRERLSILFLHKTLRTVWIDG